MELVTVSKAVIVGPDNKILILRRSAADVRRPLQWDLPGGHVDPGEYPAEAAARETMEEAGIVIDSQEIQLFYSMTEAVELDDEKRGVTWLFFLSKIVTDEVHLSHEHDEFRWVTIDEAIDKIEYERQRRVLEYARDNTVLALAK